MRSILFISVCSLIASGNISAASYEPVDAAGDFHEVVLENDRVRVLAVTILPGETVPFHQHTMESVFVTLHPASLVFP